MSKNLALCVFTVEQKLSVIAFYLNYTMVNRCVLFFSQHHQGNDNNSCYDNTSDH